MALGIADAALLVAVGASAVGLVWLRRRPASPVPGEKAKDPASPITAVPPGFLPVLDAQTLYREIGAEPLLFRIRQALGFAPENHAKDVQPLLDEVAEFIQLLPASESHHHANPGGLLTHALEVTAVALLRCEEAKLPIGRPTEEQLKHAARWRYGILVAALLHDIGKPVADVIIDVLTQKGGLARWNGLGGKMADYGSCYRVGFPLQHEYTAHQRLPVMLLKSMVPATTMRWLADDPELVATLIAYLSNESDGGLIGKLVKLADGKSVADNLLSGTRTRFASARQVPLVERMMEAMRRMLAEGAQLPLNREGAAGFCDGTDLWFVAGTIADKVRAYLDAHETRETGAADLPADNSRLFDVWLDYGGVLPNAGGAIWKAQVSLDKGEGKTWTQVFTMLRFPLGKLYAGPDQYPAALNGRIEVVAAAVPAQARDPGQPPDGEAETPVAQSQELPEASARPTGGPDTALPPPAAQETSPDLGLAPVPMDIDGGIAPPETALGGGHEEFLDEADSAGAVVGEVPKPSSAAPPPAAVPTAPVAPAQIRVPDVSVAGTITQPDPEIERMMAWLQQGIGAGSIAYNRSSAAVHFVAAGMLLISPKIFREFLDANGGAGGDGARVKQLQRLLQKSGYVVKNRPNSYLHYYRIVNAKNPERSLVTGYLVANPRLFFNPIPEANVHLEPSPGSEAAR